MSDLPTLSQGALLDVCQGEARDGSVFQYLSSKKIAGSQTERYRLLLNDGMYSNSYAMLATQLNHLITDKVLTEYAILKVNKCQCNNMQAKRVVILLDVEILRPGPQVGQKIGSPIPINADGSVNENDKRRVQQAMAAGQKAGKRTGEEAAEQPVAKKPLQQSNNCNSGGMLNTSSSADSVGSHSVYPIASLTPYQNKWTIKARVTHKSDIRKWSNARGEGTLFSMDLLDESGEIRATAFKDQCTKYYDMIEVGKVYFITQGSLKAANRQYSNLNNEYEITFRDSTEVTPCNEEDTSAIPTITFNFCKISSLTPELKDSTVDVIGVCKTANEVSTIMSQKLGKELRKRDIVLVDQSLTEVNLTLWGTAAEKFEGANNPVVAIKGAKVSDYNGVSLGGLSSSVIQIDPDIPQCHDLKGWYESEGSKAETNSLTVAANRGGNDYNNSTKTLGEVKKENLGFGSDKPEYYSTTATISLIQKDKALYQACCNQTQDGKTCNKKVQDQGNGMYRCEKCNVETESFQWRLILSLSVSDATDNQWVNSFQEQGESILGTSSMELGALQETDKAAYDRVFAAATFKKFNFRMRCKADFYNDEQRVRHTILSVTPVNYMDYNKKLIQDLEAAGIPLPSNINRDKYM